MYKVMFKFIWFTFFLAPERNNKKILHFKLLLSFAVLGYHCLCDIFALMGLESKFIRMLLTNIFIHMVATMHVDVVRMTC